MRWLKVYIGVFCVLHRALNLLIIKKLELFIILISFYISYTENYVNPYTMFKHYFIIGLKFSFNV